MFKPFEFCIPTKSTSVPAGPEWLHEIKYDGFRMLVQRDGDRVRLITRNGHDWTKRYPWIVQDALKNRHKQFVIDGEAVILGVDGYSDFNALHAGRHNEEVQLGAFDVLAMDGDDLRDLRLSLRKANLQRLLARRPDERPLNPTNRRTRQESSMWGNLPLTRKAPYKVFGCRDRGTIHALQCPASEKRQGTKSRDVGGGSAAGSMGIWPRAQVRL